MIVCGQHGLGSRGDVRVEEEVKCSANKRSVSHQESSCTLKFCTPLRLLGREHVGRVEFRASNFVFHELSSPEARSMTR